MLNRTRVILKSFWRSLWDPSKFVGALFIGLLAAAVWSTVSVYWSNGLSLATFSSGEHIVVRDALHTSFAGRVLFFIMQTISWGVLIWPVSKLYKALENEELFLGMFAIFGLFVTVPASFWFLQISGWLIFNDKSIFMRDLFSGAIPASS